MRGWTGEGGRDPDIRVVEECVGPVNVSYSCIWGVPLEF